MGLLDNVKKAAENAGIADTLKDKAGIDLNQVDLSGVSEDTVKKIRDLAGKTLGGKIDIAAIAKKAGVSEDVVKKVLDALGL